MQKTLETERLRLELWKPRDAEALFAYAKNPNVGPNAGWKPHANVAESRAIIRQLFMKDITWKIVYKETGEIIGSIGLENDKRRPGVKSKELGYSLAEHMWGNGIMTEAARAVLDYAYGELGCKIVSIVTSPNNERSQGVIRKLGFTYEGHERYVYKMYDGEVRDSLVYSMYPDEFYGKE